MEVETPVEVVGVDAAHVLLRVRGSCSGCSGCAGRCGLGWREGRVVALPREAFGALARPGACLRLHCEAAELRDRALVGYGLPLAGLLLGALAGWPMSAWLGTAINPMVAVFASLGTLTGLGLSKRFGRPLPWARLVEVRQEVEAASDPAPLPRTTQEVGSVNKALIWVLAGLLGALLPTRSEAQLPDFTGLVEQVSPAVVNISAQRVGGGAGADAAPDPEDVPELFRRFFGDPGMPRAPQQRMSMGTGFLISADGYLITNHHVVDGADEIYVRLTDRRELKASLVGSDAQTDIAVLKVEASGLPFLRMGTSRDLKPGQWVVAIGSPFGFENSVTAGIVSAVGRASFDPSQQYVPFIQTDVAINRGNSGGPLLDIEGRVVGVNSQIYSNTGGFMGVSFSIPVEVAMRSADQLKEKGYVSRGLLGVNIQEVNRDAARALGMERPMGAAITAFAEDSAARKAGLEVGDVIVAFNGEEIRSASDLPPVVGLSEPGSKATVTVVREGKRRDFQVVIGEAPRPEPVAGSAGGAPAASNPLGILTEDLSDEQREALGIDEGQGVLVRDVSPAVARSSGLRMGDVILMVGRSKVGSAQAFRELTSDLPEGEPVLLLVRRGEATQFVTVTPAAD